MAAAAGKAHFRADDEITRVEWKTRGHDEAPGLHDALVAHGFEPGEPESIMIGPLRALADLGEVPEGVTVVSALHSVSAAALASDEELDEDIPICGDRKADKARVAALIERIDGLRAVNAGALEMARIVETLTPMLIAINARYKTRAGIRITGLPDGDHWNS